MNPSSTMSRLAPLALLAGFATGCQSTGRLAEYQFADRALFVVYDFPPRPQVLTGPYFPGEADDPVEAIIRAGGRIAREVAAADVRHRLEAACTQVDVSARVAERASGRAARFLRTELVDDEALADFGLEVRILEYGIDAEQWDAAAHFFIEAEVVLFDVIDGSEIWQSVVGERDPIGPHVFGRGPAQEMARDLVTAATLANMSEEDIVFAIEGLADYSADRISERLRDSLEEVRNR